MKIFHTFGYLKNKIETINNIIQETKKDLLKKIKEINHLAPGNMFDEKTYWRIYQDKNQITFIDIIKGIINVM